MNRLLRASLIAAASALLALSPETRGPIFGLVLDAPNSAVPGAVVTVTNLATNASVRLRTNDTGYYEANLLLAGDYQVSAEMPGFKKTVRSGINLPISARVDIELRLAVGDTTETISVTAEAPLLDVSSISAGRVMENRSVM